MKSWEEILLDKNIPNPIPAPPHADLDEKFGFINREKEENELLRFINKAKVENRGFLIFLLGNQGKGKTTFLRHIKEKYSYKKSDVLFVFMNFPQNLSELNFSFIYKNFIKEFFLSDAISDAYEKILNNFKKPESEEDVVRLINNIKSEIEKLPSGLSTNPYLVSFIIASLKPSPYFYDIYNYIYNDEELSEDIPIYNFLIETKESIAITKLVRFSKFLKNLLNINHIVLIIDDFDVLDRDEKVFKSLYKTLMNFRNNQELLKNFSLIFSGSVDFYDGFIQSLSQNERGRIENWVYTIFFESFETEDFINLINCAFSKFWKKFNEEIILPENVFTVFNKETLSFLYEYENRDLRNVLRKLYDLIEKMRENGKIIYYQDIKNFIKEFKKDKIGLNEIEVKYFIDEIGKKVKLEKSSTFINKRIALIFNHLKDYFKLQKIYIEVNNEEKISDGKADVLLKITKEDNKYYEVIFEVKIKESKVNYNDIESRIKMLKESENRYLYWITKSPLEKIVIESQIEKRILRESVLKDFELAYLSYLIHIPEIFDLNEFDENSLITIIKQSGIDLDLILNPPFGGPIQEKRKNLDEEIEKILKEISETQTYAKKETIFKKLIEKGLNNYARDFLILKISEISGKMGFNATKETIRFKTKEI